MSQQQPQRPQPEPIKYGDVFPTVQGELADEPIKPQDAAMMQSAENLVMGQTQKGGPAAIMQSAATKNEQAGLVSHNDVSDVPADQGVAVTETDLPGGRVITESVAGQMVGEYMMPAQAGTGTGASTIETMMTAGVPDVRQVNEKITIGEALEAAGLTAADKPIEKSDAAAIQAAEIRATGINENLPGGVAAAAQAAANFNARFMRDEDKTKLGDVLADATTKLLSDKEVTRSDAERVAMAEMRNNQNLAPAPGGVAASVAAAARLNEKNQI